MPQDNRQAILQSLSKRVKPVREDIVRVGKPPRTTEPVNPLETQEMRKKASDVADKTAEMAFGQSIPAGPTTGPLQQTITTGPNDLAKNAARNAALRKRTATI